ncbi:MAG: hypothetical protein JW751_04325 [Polyangiaceae bacterium]|nr:hypothetical protein [Polyangiaceae bacterium]
MILVRTKLILVLLIGLIVLLIGGVARRQRSPHLAPVVPTTSAAAPSAGASGRPTPSTSGSVVGSLVSAAPSSSSATSLGLGRPLAVVGLGWDLLTPGIVANGGLAPQNQGTFGRAGILVRLLAADSQGAVEATLARGGADDKGADVALLPLPTFVAAYERLRALDLEIFYVVGWHHGREVLESTELESLTELRADQEISLYGALGSPATFLGLATLELSGIEPERVTLVHKPELARVRAMTRSDGRPPESVDAQVLLGTGDASRLIPVVAVAQRGLLSQQRRTLVTWTRAWLEAMARVESDPTAAARLVAAQPNAPEPVELLARLGSIARASVASNTEMLRLAGRGAVSADVLFFTTYDLWRAARLLMTPPPERAPVTGEVIASLVLADPKLVEDEPSQRPSTPAPASRATVPGVLLAHPVAGQNANEALIVERLGFLAGIFPRSALRLTVHRPARTDKDGRITHRSPGDVTTSVIQCAADRYGFSPTRVRRGKAPAQEGRAATIEVLAVE